MIFLKVNFIEILTSHPPSHCLCYRTTLHIIFQWPVRTALISDTQNPEISGFSTAHAYEYKTKRQAKNETKTEKNDIFCCLKSIALRTYHKQGVCRSLKSLKFLKTLKTNHLYLKTLKISFF